MIIERPARTDGYMNAVQVIEVIHALSKSQGMYARMYSALVELRETNEEAFNAWCDHMEKQNFKDSVDVVIYLES